MSKITKLLVRDFLGIKEMGLAPGKINMFRGPMGSGKSSVIEAIEKGFTNNNRRTEVVRHGAEEATLFIELDNGLEIDRRIRSEKSDYLKLRKENEYVPSTEKFLRSLVKGEVFRPIEWVNKDVKEQTNSILNMVDIPLTQDNIMGWFGEVTYNIDYSRHTLQVLKAIEIKYYNDREEINREIRELRSQMTVIVKELPAGYDGEAWRELKVQEFFNKVQEAVQINQWIEEAKAFQQNLESGLSALEDRADSEKNKVRLRIKEQRSDIKDIIDMSAGKLERAEKSLEEAEVAYGTALRELDCSGEREKAALELELAEKIRELEMNFATTLRDLETAHNSKLTEIRNKSLEGKEKLKVQLEVDKEELRDLISINESKIAAKKQEMLSMEAIEAAELEAVEAKKVSEIEKLQLGTGQAADYLKRNEPVEVKPLQMAAEEVVEMQSYLRQWDMLLDIRDNKLASKEKYAAWLTANIERARSLPGELLKSAKMPIEGISLDDKGLIRINGTLIDGLSDGEKLQLAMKIARAQAGDLKVICLDRWESLNEKTQKKLLEEMEQDDFQYFVTVAADTDGAGVEVSRS